MNLARHSISSTAPVLIFDARFDPDCCIFTASTPAGFAVYRTWPLQLLRKREITGGTLSFVVPLHTSSLLFLVGGGRSPRYPPNKVILWDDALGQEVAELEFRERVRGLACRRGLLVVALRRRVVVFEVGDTVTRYGEWDTSDNPRGLLALSSAAHSTLLAIPGRQMGHVQLVHLPPCPPPQPSGPPSSSLPLRSPPAPTKHPVSIIAAHHTALTTLSVPPSGRLLATTSNRGTLIRIWDTTTGKLEREFRRGADKAVIYGVAFRPDEREVCVWSDKGTVHIFSLATGSGSSNRQSTFSQLTPFLPLPKYFGSEWSYAQYHIPSQSSHISISTPPSKPPTADVVDEEKCVVGWIQVPSDDQTDHRIGSIAEHQLVALTYTGGWYRLSVPTSVASTRVQTPVPSSGIHISASPPSVKTISMARPRSSSGSSFTGRPDKGKERERDKDGKDSRELDALAFKPSKSQRKHLNRWNRFVLFGDAHDNHAMDDVDEQRGLGRGKGKKSSSKSHTFSLVDVIHASEDSFLKDQTSVHKFEVTLEPSSYSAEKFALYESYQRQIHHEDHVTSVGFKRFLIESPLHLEPIQYISPRPAHLPEAYGSYHQLYRLDGELIAVGVIDILPTVYPASTSCTNENGRDFPLGSALRETSLAKEMHDAGVVDMTSLYMGFYVHSCPKMRYKGEYSPSYLVDPEEYTWVPFEVCRPLLDKYRYACFVHPEHSIEGSYTGGEHTPQVSDELLAEAKVCIGARDGKAVVIPITAAREWQRPAARSAILCFLETLTLSIEHPSTFLNLVHRHRTLNWTLSALVWLPTGIIFTEYFYNVKAVRGRSMQPTLNPDTSRWQDIVIFDRFSIIWRRYNRGDVVALRSPVDSKLIVKRIIALEGDTVCASRHYRHTLMQKSIFQKGMPGWKARSRLLHSYSGSNASLIAGDEPFRTEDSNRFGPVPLALIESKLAFIVFPWERIGPLPKAHPPDPKAPRGPAWRQNKAEIEREQWRSSRVTIGHPHK
ncbi:WD repeat domain phosphoinositide-interacting protein 3 [Grifola frondosa]|uniref:Mitochondrial inner membrane protease subunit n=1 Tax=Grifola frondosa TaxID=5627 RepID=A0A1C7MIZ5_GRIFR|nr:WD repeat domain phosphoinositide-interacting protein 3 [Grifola frondosa]